MNFSSTEVRVHIYRISRATISVTYHDDPSDGAIAATATGSTAYSVSAGGSMVHPNVPAILMTPICPHTLSFRPVIFPDSVNSSSESAKTPACSAAVSFDGRDRCELESGDSIFVRMSQFPIPTINYADQTGDFIFLAQMSAMERIRRPERLRRLQKEAPSKISNQEDNNAA